MSELETLVRRPSPERTERKLPEVTGAWAIATGIVWLVGLQAMFALEPPPTHPDALPGFMLTAMAVVLNTALLVMAVGLIRRLRWAFAVSAGAALLNAGGVVACPVSGHHVIGLWWAAQATIAAGLVVFSLVGWQAAARSGSPADQLTG